MKWYIAATLLTVAVLGFGYFVIQGGYPDDVTFNFEQIKKGSITETVIATGTVTPIKLVRVGSQVSGTIDKIHVDFNSVVKEGDVICELDKRTLSARVEQDSANLSKAKSGVLSIKSKLSVAKKELKRSRQLLADELVSKSEFDKQKADYEVLDAEMEIAQAEVQQAEAALKLSKTNLDLATIRSPVNGVVIQRSVDVGQTVAASLQAPTLFEIAEDLQKLYILASVGEADIGKVKKGQPVKFKLDAYPSDQFAGVVQQIRLSPTTAQNVVTYTVVITTDNVEGKLLPGMTANLSFEISKSPDGSLLVANSALRFIPDKTWIKKEERGEIKRSGKTLPTIWIMEGELLVPVIVEIGITDGSLTHVFGQGLKEGMKVVSGVRVKGVDLNMTNPFSSRFRR